MCVVRVSTAAQRDPSATTSASVSIVNGKPSGAPSTPRAGSNPCVVSLRVFFFFLGVCVVNFRVVFYIALAFCPFGCLVVLRRRFLVGDNDVCLRDIVFAMLSKPPFDQVNISTKNLIRRNIVTVWL